MNTIIVHLVVVKSDRKVEQKVYFDGVKIERTFDFATPDHVWNFVPGNKGLTYKEAPDLWNTELDRLYNYATEMAA